MYYYILDAGTLSDAEFERKQTKLLALTHEFNIRGETGRVSPLRHIKDLIETAQRRQVKTLVICGSDDTFNQVLGALAGQQFTLAFVPLVEKTQLADMLGITDMESAVRILAARRITVLDTAKVGNIHFLSYMEFGLTSDSQDKTSLFGFLKRSTRPIQFKAQLDDNFEINTECLGGLVVNAKGWQGNSQIGIPNDGRLDLVIAPAGSIFHSWQSRDKVTRHELLSIPGTSIFPFQKIRIIEPVGLPLTMLGRQILRAPTEISIAPNFLQIIVGRNRTF